MLKRVLVTGAQGFIGSHLVRHLRKQQFDVVAPDADLFDFEAWVRTLSREQPDTVVHLAGISSVIACEKDVGLAYRTNVTGTALLMEALSSSVPTAHLVFPSTAQVYAAPASDENGHVVFDETREVKPQNIYARTKRTAELILESKVLLPSGNATILRLFNHTHHTQSKDFFLPHIYHALLEAQRAGSSEISVGNLNLIRDFGSIKDLMFAFEAVIRKGSIGVETYNVASGAGKRLKTVAELLAKRMAVEATFVTDSKRLRPGEPEILVGNPSKLTQATGWSASCRTESDLVQAFLEPFPGESE